MHKSFASEPKNDRGDDHCNARCPKSSFWPSKDNVWPFAIKQPWNEHGRKGRTGVDREVKPTEHAREKMLVRGTKLIAHIRAHARLDAARPERDECQPADQARTRVVERQHKMTEAIHD